MELALKLYYSEYCITWKDLFVSDVGSVHWNKDVLVFFWITNMDKHDDDSEWLFYLSNGSDTCCFWNNDHENEFVVV